MGAWGEGMQANDTALDDIGRLEDIITGVSWKDRQDTPTKDEQVRKWIKENKIREALDEGYDSWGRLGIAEWLMDHGVRIPYTIVKGDVDRELERIEDWQDPEERRRALHLFEKRCRGGVLTHDEKSELEHTNRGLFQRIAEDLNGKTEVLSDGSV